MVVLGVDVHKDSHHIVGIDEAGRELVSWSSGTRTRDCEALIARAREAFGGERVWAVEDCRHVSGRLERALLHAGERCYRVPPKLMAGARASARTRGKSDPIDALAIARAVLANPGLPVAEHTHASRELKLLVDHREDLVGTRTRIDCRLRWHLHDLNPDVESGIPLRRLHAPKFLEPLRGRLARMPKTTQVRVCRDLVNDIADLTRREKALEREITDLVRQQAPQLLDIPGCGVLTAAKIVAETGNPARFRNEACFAMHAGVAPIPASSGRTNRYRLARGGNRQLNAAMHRIAVTQMRLAGPGRIYFQHRRELGDSNMDALRVMKRKIAKRVFKTLNTPTTSTVANNFAIAA
jgi:transposase